MLIFSNLIECLYSFLESQSIPSFTKLPNEETSVFLKDAVTLPCSAEGNPPPKIVAWLFDGKRVNTRSGRHFLRPNGDLYITNTQKSDSGTYQCVAQNTVGGIASTKKKLFVTCKCNFINVII